VVASHEPMVAARRPPLPGLLTDRAQPSACDGSSIHARGVVPVPVMLANRPMASRFTATDAHELTLQAWRKDPSSHTRCGFRVL